MIKHKHIYEGDKDHLHHQLLKMHLSPTKTVFVIYIINILFSIAAIIYTINDAKLGTIMYIILFIVVLWIILHTSIISDKLPKETKKFEKNLFKKKK